MRSFKILALVAILGLGACSTKEVKDSDFLDQVKGKEVFDKAGLLPVDKVGEFSADGKTYGNYTFSSIEDENTAKYKNTVLDIDYTFTVSGNELTRSLPTSPNSPTLKYYLK